DRCHGPRFRWTRRASVSRARCARLGGEQVEHAGDRGAVLDPEHGVAGFADRSPPRPGLLALHRAFDSTDRGPGARSSGYHAYWTPRPAEAARVSWLSPSPCASAASLA